MIAQSWYDDILLEKLGKALDYMPYFFFRNEHFKAEAAKINQSVINRTR